jgi:hypothetical protein
MKLIPYVQAGNWRVRAGFTVVLGLSQCGGSYQSQQNLGYDNSLLLLFLIITKNAN